MQLQTLFRLRGHKGSDVCKTTAMHLLTYVEIQPNGCWNSKLSKLRGGYPCIRIEKKLYTASRLVAWLAYQFEISNPKVFVCHSCDNPICINPNHLFIGDAKINNADAARKFRTKKRRAKPTERDLAFLAKLEQTKSIEQAARYSGISTSYARTIKSIHLPYWLSTGAYPQKESTLC